MEIQNILRTRFKRTITDVTPILKSRLTPYQYEQLMITLEIAQEGVLDSLDEIMNGKEPSFDDFEDDFEIISDEEE